MFQKLLTNIALKIAGALASSIVSTIEKTMASIIEKYEEKRLTELKGELYQLRVDLMQRERLSNAEAIEFAERINSIRGKL